MKRYAYLALGLALVILSAASIASGQAGTFVIEGADDSANLGLQPSGPLANLLDGIAPRIVFQFADGNRNHPLLTVPQDLQGLLDQVKPRIVFQFADGNVIHRVDYPVVLIKDDAPPNTSGRSVTTPAGGQVTIKWTTDEFTRGKVAYGTQAGQLTESVEDPLYKKQHEINLRGLDSGTYFGRLYATDRSGNTASSTEFTFDVTDAPPPPDQPFALYLPLLEAP